MPITIEASAQIGAASTWSARSTQVMANGNWYTLVEKASGPLLMRKSTDKGATYSTVDSANGPTPSTLPGCFDTYRFGTDIYVVYQHAFGSIGRVKVFHTATDLWDASTVGNANITTAVDFQRPVRVAVRSDGDVLVWRYNGTGLQMAKWQPTVWNNTAALAAGYPHDLIMNGSDVAIGIYKDTAASDESWVTVTGADAQASGDFDTTAHTTIHPRGGQMATYNDGTNDKFFTLSLDATGSTMDGYHSSTGAAPSGTLVNALTSITPQLGSWACQAFNGQVYVVWAEANTIKYRVSTSLTTLTFAAEVTLISGLTDIDPCPTLLSDEAGSALTVIYQDAGDVKHEYIVAPTGGGPDLINGTDSSAITGDDAIASLAIVGTVTDTNAITGTEAISLARASTVADTSAITGTDTAILTTLEAKAADDTSTITGTDTAALAFASTVADTSAVAGADAVTLANASTSTDTSLITGTDAAALARASSVTDTNLITGTDIVALVNTSTVTDTSAITGTDAATVTTLDVKAASDTGLLTGTDAATLLVQDAKSGTDTGAIGSTDAATVVVLLTISDMGVITGTDASLVASTFTVTETGALVGTDAASLFVTLVRADSVILTGDDTAAAIDTGDIGPAGDLVFALAVEPMLTFRVVIRPVLPITVHVANVITALVEV